MAADDNDLESMFKYGLMRLEGDGIEIDTNEANKYLKMAAEKDYDIACVYNNQLLYSGKTIEQNKKEAAYYFKKSADNGNQYSQWIFGQMLKNGDGIEININ